MAGQFGLEKTPQEYIAKMAALFTEVRRVLGPSGTVWLNIGDCYFGSGKGWNLKPCKQDSNPGSRHRCLDIKHLGKGKDLVGLPWRVAFALQESGWYLRSDIIWHKPNPMPESVTDRPTRAHEYLFLLSKSSRYYYDAAAIREELAEPERVRCDQIGGNKGKETHHSPGGMYRQDKQRGHGRRHNGFNDRQANGANKRDVWTVTPAQYKEAHFATFPEALIDPCIRAGCPAGGIVLDPFMGSGTTAIVAAKMSRNWARIELNPKYIEMAKRRLGLFAEITA